jgi:hypothetical protein
MPGPYKVGDRVAVMTDREPVGPANFANIPDHWGEVWGIVYNHGEQPHTLYLRHEDHMTHQSLSDTLAVVEIVEAGEDRPFSGRGTYLCKEVTE